MKGDLQLKKKTAWCLLQLCSLLYISIYETNAPLSDQNNSA